MVMKVKAYKRRRVSDFKRFLRVFFSRGIVVFGLLIITALVIFAAFAPLISPYDPYEQSMGDSLQKPNRQHWLGTDAVGRDTLSRIIFGSRTSLMIGIVAVAASALVGMTLGLIAGFFGGYLLAAIMRFIDAMMCFPPILMALLLSALLGAGLRNVMIAIAIALVPAYCRLMCAQVLATRENEYITAAHSIGSTNTRIMARHVLPNCFPPLIVLFTMNIGMAILSEAGLSFLGLGIEMPKAAWGSMVSDGYLYLRTQPVLSFAPGLAIMLVVFAFNMVGDGLRDALDPKLRGTL